LVNRGNQAHFELEEFCTQLERKVQMENNELNNEQNWELKIERYSIQKELWPQSGRHILAQYNDEAILVYQAYNKQIAEYAVQHQKFGGPDWNSTRMTWIKTNFLWMMFRSGWGEKSNQERILGLWLKRKSFERYISMASNKEHSKKGSVRLQWDPDHYPSGERHPFRKAIQLGLKNVESFINGEDIVLIQDITDFVYSQHAAIKCKDFDSLITPEERIYNVPNMDEEPEGPLRVILLYKGKQKVVILRGRDERELTDMVIQKLKIKPKMITLPSGKIFADRLPEDLPQGSILIIS